MPRRLVVTGTVLAAAVFMLAAGCAQDSNTGQQQTGGVTATTVVTESPTTQTSPQSSPSVTQSPADPLTLSVNGIGPYSLGAGTTLDQLESAHQITDVTTGGETCPASFGAKGIDKWTDVVLYFTPDRNLDLVITHSNTLHTPSGARVGMTLTQLQNIYGTRGQVLAVGGAKAYIVKTSSGRALYFDLDAGNIHVVSIIAGGSERLSSRFLNGSDC